jgi:hypothetical protein
VQHQGRDDVVERTIGERQRAADIGEEQVRALAEPPPGQLQHLGAGIEAGHDRAPVTQRRRQGARPAAGADGRGPENPWGVSTAAPRWHLRPATR